MLWMMEEVVVIGVKFGLFIGMSGFEWIVVMCKFGVFKMLMF